MLFNLINNLINITVELCVPNTMHRRNTNAFNFGKHLEEKLYERLLELGYFQTIADEEHLKRLWGWKAASVDYLLEISGMVIMIQCKWRRSRRRENKGINNFLGSVEYIKNKNDKPLLFGLWISRVDPFEDNIEVLNNKHIICVSEFNSIDWLVDKAISTLRSKLEETGII